MKKLVLVFCLVVLSTSFIACDNRTQRESSKELGENQEDSTNKIDANGNLHINLGNETITLEINALADSQILEDENQRLLILSDPTDQYQHGILGDGIEASSVTIVQVSDKATIVSDFSVAKDWVIESIRPIWSDWDGDGKREILLTLSNSTKGAKLVLYDEKGEFLAESLPIGKGFRWRHALEIASFGEDGQMLLVDVQTPHIGGIVNFYSWDKEKKLLKTEASLPGYSTHDIGSRFMHMYSLLIDEQNEQALLLVPDQSKKELVALRLVSGAIQEEWRMALGGTLSGNLELIDDNGVPTIRGIIENDREVLLKLPEY